MSEPGAQLFEAPLLLSLPVELLEEPPWSLEEDGELEGVELGDLFVEDWLEDDFDVLECLEPLVLPLDALLLRVLEVEPLLLEPARLLEVFLAEVLVVPPDLLEAALDAFDLPLAGLVFDVLWLALEVELPPPLLAAAGEPDVLLVEDADVPDERDFVAPVLPVVRRVLLRFLALVPVLLVAD